MKSADESRRTALLSEINKRLAAWVVAPPAVSLPRYDWDRYLFLFEEFISSIFRRSNSM